MAEITPERLDALSEAINVGVGRAAAGLNEIVDTHITLGVPRVEMMLLEALVHEKWVENRQVCCVTLGFAGGLDGSAALILPIEDAAQFVSLMLDEEGMDDCDLNALRAGTMSEVGNIVINGILGTLSNLLKHELTFFLPNYMEGDGSEILRAGVVQAAPAILVIRTRFHIEKLDIVGNIVLVFELPSLDRLMEHIGSLYDE